MALYEFSRDQVKFLQTMVAKVMPQGSRDEIKIFIKLGDEVLNSLNHPILPAGKPKSGIKGLTPEEEKVIAECIS